MFVALIIGLAASCLAVYSVVSVLRQERKLDSKRLAMNVQEQQRESSQWRFATASDVIPLIYGERDQGKIEGSLNPGSRLVQAQEGIDHIELEKAFAFQTSLIRGTQSMNRYVANGGGPFELLEAGFLKQEAAA